MLRYIRAVLLAAVATVLLIFAFANLQDPQKEFGPVRLWGTIGWIAASWPFVFILLDWSKVPAIAETGGVVEWLGKALGSELSGNALNQGKSWAFLVSGIASPTGMITPSRAPIHAQKRNA